MQAVTNALTGFISSYPFISAEAEAEALSVAATMDKLDSDERAAALILAITLLAEEVDHIRSNTMSG